MPSRCAATRCPDLGGGGRGVRQKWARLLPDFLKPLGYRNYHCGKWHIDGKVLAGGFDRSLDTRNQGNFFTAKGNMHRRRPMKPAADRIGLLLDDRDRRPCDRVPAGARRATRRPAVLPLPRVHRAAFPAPALPEDIARYRDRYLDGWDKMREQRFARQREMGLLDTTLSKLEPESGRPTTSPRH